MQTAGNWITQCLMNNGSENYKLLKKDWGRL
jgi:hypothetical protein